MLTDLAKTAHIATLALGTNWVPKMLPVLEPYQLLE
jgi:hypothetical protein